MSAALTDKRKSGMLRRRSAVLLVIGVGVFGLFDPPAGRETTPAGGTILIRRSIPPVATEGGTQLGPATRITKLPRP